MGNGSVTHSPFVAIAKSRCGSMGGVWSYAICPYPRDLCYGASDVWR